MCSLLLRSPCFQETVQRNICISMLIYIHVPIYTLTHIPVHTYKYTNIHTCMRNEFLSVSPTSVHLYSYSHHPRIIDLYTPSFTMRIPASKSNINTFTHLLNPTTHLKEFHCFAHTITINTSSK